MGECGVAPDYFLDKMSAVEIEAYLDGYNKRQRASWEQTRILACMSVQPHSRKKITPESIFPLPWDEVKEKVQHDPDALTRLRERVKRFK